MEQHGPHLFLEVDAFISGQLSRGSGTALGFLNPRKLCFRTFVLHIERF
jgi:creatinine amidohydrolase/Fe(II)-dependent formamide hydrolase-like protein